MVKIELAQIRKNLKRGDQKQISEELGVSSVFVNNVLMGKRKSLKVIEAALKVAQENKAKQAEVTKQISEL